MEIKQKMEYFLLFPSTLVFSFLFPYHPIHTRTWGGLMIIQNQVVQKPTFFPQRTSFDFLSNFVDYKFTILPFPYLQIHSFIHSFTSPIYSILFPKSYLFSIKIKYPNQKCIYMSTTVCQNIVFSCFEPQLMAETATTLKLRVAEAPPASDSQFTNWVCRRIFYDDPTNSKESLENYGFYVDPLSERSSISRLSAKSLEMCTENLGSETGTDTITDGGSIFSSSASSFDQEKSLSSKENDQEKLRNRVRQPRNEEANPCRKFPPPLTTMSGKGSIQVRRHCEGGRLIIKAVERPLRISYLQAERSGGRLRLCYLTDSESDSDLDTAEPPQEVEEEEHEAGPGFESGTGEIGFQMLSRCKESRGHENGGLCSNWKPAFWVATS